MRSPKIKFLRFIKLCLDDIGNILVMSNYIISDAYYHMAIDPISASVIKKMDKIATPTAQGFLPIIIDKITGYKISTWTAQGKIAYEKEMIEWEKRKDLIMAFNGIEISRKINNFLGTVEKANKYIDPSKKFSIEDDNDVFWGLLEHSKTVSSEEVQEIIARIIAGEYNKPGSYAMSTLQTLKFLSKRELKMLSFFGSLYVDSRGFFRSFFYMDTESLKARTNLKVDYGEFLELQNLGLIQSGYYTQKISIKKDTKLIIKYHSQEFEVIAIKDIEDANFPECYELTLAGKEILRNLKIEESKVFIEWLQNELLKFNLQLLLK